MPITKKKQIQDSLFKPDIQKIVFEIDIENDEPQLFYSKPKGELYFGDVIKWLKTLRKGSVTLCFADPPYNIKKADWDSFESQEKYIDWSLEWIELVSRSLSENGSMYICGFSEILADLKRPAMKFFKTCRWLVWHYKNKANLGNGWGRSHESILHFRKSKDFIFNINDIRIPYSRHTLKYPEHPQALTSQYRNGNSQDNHLWHPNPKGAKPKDVIDIPTTCNGSLETTPHPTQKPEELVRKFVLASSNEGDMVIDPFSGSGTTLVVAEELKRSWKGCDNNLKYNQMAVYRLENAIKKTKEEWIEYDRNNLYRRESIR
jgi:site-specific DNA-methyltransferase (adenine-specific)